MKFKYLVKATGRDAKCCLPRICVGDCRDEAEAREKIEYWNRVGKIGSKFVDIKWKYKFYKLEDNHAEASR